jgi:hypothetical protein
LCQRGAIARRFAARRGVQAVTRSGVSIVFFVPMR